MQAFRIVLQSKYLVLNISADFWQGEGKKKLGEENLSGPDVKIFFAWQIFQA
jgi:hypothetical protein